MFRVDTASRLSIGTEFLTINPLKFVLAITRRVLCAVLFPFGIFSPAHQHSPLQQVTFLSSAGRGCAIKGM
jgi:hypothetical protein